MEITMAVIKYSAQILLVFGFGYLLVVTAAFVFQDKLTFIPAKEHIATPGSVGLEFEDHYYTTSDGFKIHAWFIVNPESELVVQLSHGNAGNISGRAGLAAMLYDAGFSVFMYDYRGYGKSEGSPDEDGLYKDAAASYQYIISETGTDPGNIVQFGRSLGGAVATRLASMEKSAGLIIDSSFTSLKELVTEVYPFLPAFLARYDFETKQHLANIKKIPVLILHSRDDNLIGIHHGKQLYETAASSAEFVELEGGHNDAFLVSEDKYTEAIRNFREKIESGMK